MRASFIAPGRMRTELTLEAMTGSPDGAGGQIESWAEIGTVMALVEPLSATDAVLADARAETVTHRITIRHRVDVSAGMRFSRLTRRFEVRSVHDPDESGRYLVCRCREARR